VDEAAYAALALAQRERSRAARKDVGADGWKNKGISANGLPATDFIGYGENESQAELLAVLLGEDRRPNANPGETVALVLDKTPFYAESGGQTYDTGKLIFDTAIFAVKHVKKTTDGVFLHFGELISGDRISSGERCLAAIDVRRRESIRRNHTAAHLLHAALREILGDHVEQAGQSVTEHSCRFDFTHFSALSEAELLRVENRVNEIIWDAIPVTTVETSLEEAKAANAMALFGEKYGDVVRFVRVGDFSKELCGGTHAHNSEALGLFKIQSESSVAAGVRRIEAVTGAGAFSAFRQTEDILRETALELKVNTPAQAPLQAAKLMAQLKQSERELAQLHTAMVAQQLALWIANTQEIGKFKYIQGEFANASAEDLRAACDRVKALDGSWVGVFASAGEKVQLAVVCSPEAVKAGGHAGKIAKTAAQACGGSGGGKPDVAMAGGKDPAKLKDAFAAANAFLANL
jgi:alanyl-tRNA synthetase